MWAAGKDLESLARFSTTSDYYIFSSQGLSVLFFLVAGTIFLLNAASAWYLFRPEPVGYKVLLATLAASAAYSIASVLLVLSDLSGAREAYEIGREVRGLPVREADLNAIFTPKAIGIGLGLSLLVFVAIGALVVRNKRYFAGPEEFATEA